VVFFQRLLAKCAVNTLFVANILFTDDAEFTQDDVVKFIIPMVRRMTVPSPL
jgi:hypothetical protein